MTVSQQAGDPHSSKRAIMTRACRFGLCKPLDCVVHNHTAEASTHGRCCCPIQHDLMDCHHAGCRCSQSAPSRPLQLPPRPAAAARPALLAAESLASAGEQPWQRAPMASGVQPSDGSSSDGSPGGSTPQPPGSRTIGGAPATPPLVAPARSPDDAELDGSVYADADSDWGGSPCPA